MSKPFNLGDIVKIKDDVKSLNDFKYWGARVDEIFKITDLELCRDGSIKVNIQAEYSRRGLNWVTVLDEHIELINPELLPLV